MTAEHEAWGRCAKWRELEIAQEELNARLGKLLEAAGWKLTCVTPDSCWRWVKDVQWTHYTSPGFPNEERTDRFTFASLQRAMAFQQSLDERNAEPNRDAGQSYDIDETCEECGKAECGTGENTEPHPWQVCRECSRCGECGHGETSDSIGTPCPESQP